MRKILVLIFLLTGIKGFTTVLPNSNFFSPVVNFQIDSLKSLLSATLANSDHKIDTVAIDRINMLAREFINVNPDSTFYYSKLAIKQSLQLKYKKGIADGLLQMASAFIRKGDYIHARKNLSESKSLFMHLKNEKGLSDCFLAYGVMYEILGKYELSASFYRQALNIKNRINDEPGIANCYNKIGIVADDIGKTTFALDNYFKALTINIKLNNKLDIASNYNNIGSVMQGLEIYAKSMEYYQSAIRIWKQSNNVHGLSVVYQNIGEILMAQKKYGQAIGYLVKSMALNKDQDDKDGISLVYADLGLCYAAKQQYKAALNNLRQALEIATTYKMDFDKANAYIDIANVYNMQKRYNDAYKYGMLGKGLAERLGGLTIRMNASLQLSIALGGLKRFEAYAERKLCDDLRDSLKSDEIVQKITSFNLEANFAEKQRTLAEQHQRTYERYKQNLQWQELLSAFFVVIILGMGTIIIVYYRGRLKQQKVNNILEDKNQQVQQQKTDLNEQAEKLRESNVLKNRLISILAHDLRAPLSTLRGLFSLLEDATISQEQFLEIIPKVLSKLEYTSDFLDTLLFWINSQMENFNSSAKSFFVKDIVTYMIQTYNEPAVDKGITLIDNVPAPLTVLADPNSIHIVLRNLITNAIKFSGQGDTITINASQPDENFIQMSIKDTGIGMSEAQVKKLFKGNVDSETGTNNESGTGMGLFFCKDLVEKSNGKIWVESELGKGTEFFMTLPVSTLSQEAILVS